MSNQEYPLRQGPCQCMTNQIVGRVSDENSWWPARDTCSPSCTSLYGEQFTSMGYSKCVPSQFSIACPQGSQYMSRVCGRFDRVHVPMHVNQNLQCTWDAATLNPWGITLSKSHYESTVEQDSACCTRNIDLTQPIARVFSNCSHQTTNNEHQIPRVLYHNQ